MVRKITIAMQALTDWIHNSEAAKIALLAAIAGGCFGLASQMIVKLWGLFLYRVSASRQCAGMLMTTMAEMIHNTHAIGILLDDVTVQLAQPDSQSWEPVVRSMLASRLQELEIRKDAWVRLSSSDVFAEVNPQHLGILYDSYADCEILVNRLRCVVISQIPVTRLALQDLFERAKAICMDAVWVTTYTAFYNRTLRRAGYVKVILSGISVMYESGIQASLHWDDKYMRRLEAYLRSVYERAQTADSVSADYYRKALWVLGLNSTKRPPTSKMAMWYGSVGRKLGTKRQNKR